VATGIFVGLSTVDLVYGVEEFPAPNSKVAARSQVIYVGGPATNAAVAFSHLGGQATVVSAVGRHSLAAVVLDELRRLGVRHIDLCPEFEESPPISSVTVNRRGERNVVSANAVRVQAATAAVDEAALRQADVLMVDGHSMEACHAWCAAARGCGVPVVMDGGSWKAGSAELLRLVDTAICSADFKPPECGTQGDVFAFLRGCGVKRIAITHGADAVCWAEGERSGSVEVPGVEIVDTMGAGDIFHGAFCWFIASGSGFVEALEAAAGVASESCRFHGTRAWMRA